MKHLMLLGLIAFALSQAANAAVDFTCAGKIDGKDSALNLSFEAKTVVVTDTDGDEFTLELSSQNSKFKLFGDYDYDGYGGFVELRVPASFNPAAKVFNTQFQVQMFSELGHVGSEVFKGSCKRN